VSDLRLIGRSDDGSTLELQSQEGASHTLRISDHLRSLVNQSRLVAVTRLDDQPSVSVKEIQARLRSGESIDSIVRSTDWSPEKIEKYSGPIMQERAYIISLALVAGLRKEKHAPTLVSATISQLEPRGVDMALVEWNSWREDDGSWNILLLYPTKDGSFSEANWSFDLANRNLEALDDGAAWISGEELEPKSVSPSHGIVYPTQTPAPRLVAVREIIETLDLGQSSNETKRLKIPSWDDIMFGGSKEPSEEE